MTPAALRLLAVFLPSLAWLAAAAPPVECGGKYSRHLQGVCRAPSGDLYWSWTDAIARTDAEGNLLVRVEADNHQGDLCYHDGRIYVAVTKSFFPSLEPFPSLELRRAVFACRAGVFGVPREHEPIDR